MITVQMERIAAITAAKVLEQQVAEYRKQAHDPANRKHVRPSVLAVTLADADMLEGAANALREGADRW